MTYRFRSRIPTVPTLIIPKGKKGPRPPRERTKPDTECIETVAHSTLSVEAGENILQPPEAYPKRGRGATNRQMIRDSGVLGALLDYVLGKKEMSPGQVTLALNILKKILPDLSPVALPQDEGQAENDVPFQQPVVEFRIVDPAAECVNSMRSIRSSA